MLWVEIKFVVGGGKLWEIIQQTKETQAGSGRVGLFPNMFLHSGNSSIMVNVQCVLVIGKAGIYTKIQGKKHPTQIQLDFKAQ